MIDPDATAGETAISYTDQFLEAAVKKLDKVFGKGFAKENPTLVQGYIHACAINLGSFMQASIALQTSGELDGWISQLDDIDER